MHGQTLANLLGQLADIDTFTFAGTAGEAVTAWMVNTGGSGIFAVVVIDVQTCVLLSYAQGNINSQSSLTQAQPLAKTGTYTILCRDDIGTETYPYSRSEERRVGKECRVQPGE